MKNALILHGTDFARDGRQREGNWFPWLDTELTKLGYEVSRPELPAAHKPNLEKYWNSLKDFDFGAESILIGHSSGAAAIFGLLQRLSPEQKVKLVVSVAGFYRDEGWHCEDLFQEGFDWRKIRSQAKRFELLWSSDDPYISREQTDHLATHLKIMSKILENCGHFNLEVGERFWEFPELLDLINS